MTRTSEWSPNSTRQRRRPPAINRRCWPSFPESSARSRWPTAAKTQADGRPEPGDRAKHLTQSTPPRERTEFHHEKHSSQYRSVRRRGGRGQHGDAGQTRCRCGTNAGAGHKRVRAGRGGQRRPQRQEEKYTDGNVHVVIDNTWTPVSVSDVTVSFDGQAWPVVGIEGWHMTGYLFVSNPATYVGSGEQVVITSWSGDNVIDFHTDNEHSSLRETLLFFEYVDNPYDADGVVDLSKRTWEGTFELSDKSGGPLGHMPATATIAAGDPVRFTDRVRGGYERWTITPYDLQLTVDSPLAPAKVTAQLVRIQVAWHTSPQGGSEG